MVSERRLQTAEMISQGIPADQIAEELGYDSRESVYSAVKSPEVKEQIAWHRDNLFEQSRIDRVKLLRELYERTTEPTGPIFKTLRGDGQVMDAANLEKLTPLQSRLIQQIEIDPTLIKVLLDDGSTSMVHLSVVKKIRFHSPDSALKILSKAAGFEDGMLAVEQGDVGGPFRGLVILPPRTAVIDMEPSKKRPPEERL